MESSKPHHHQPFPSDHALVESLQASIQKLVIRWQRRKEWQRRCRRLQLLYCCSQEVEHQEGHDIIRAPWRVHLAELLESTAVHFVSLFLLLLDLTFTVLDLSSSLLSCANKSDGGGGERLYHWGGIAILAVLSAKSVLLVVALGTSFLHYPGLVVDGIVVTGALFLELLMESGGRGAGLLVVVSLWRVVRAVESAFELSNEAIESQIEYIKSQFKTLQDENRRLEEALSETRV